jgi:hypothetical protein
VRSVPVAYLLSLLVVNGAAFALAYRDGSLLALGIALIGGPTVNGVIALCGGILAWKERAQPNAMTVTKAIVLPGAFLVVLEIAIFQLDLRGC